MELFLELRKLFIREVCSSHIRLWSPGGGGIPIFIGLFRHCKKKEVYIKLMFFFKLCVDNMAEKLIKKSTTEEIFIFEE